MSALAPRIRRDGRRWVSALWLGPILALGWGCSGGGSSSAETVPTLDGRRWVEPRLTGAWDHTPCRYQAADPASQRLLSEPDCYPADDSSASRHPWRKWVSSWFREKAEAPEGPHALALLTLISTRRAEDAEKAVTILEGLAQENPSDAALWSDLSAARQVLAQRADSPSDLARALAASEKAVALRETPEALFNRALALEALFLDESAREAWQAYLAVDPDGPWGLEAARRLKTLKYPDSRERWERLKKGLDSGSTDDLQAAMRSYPAATRRHIQEEVLAEWAEARAAGLTDQSGRLLALARRIAELVHTREGDQVLLESVAAIETALKTPQAARLDSLVAGHRAFGEAIRLQKSLHLEPAADSYRKAIAQLRRADTPFVAWAEVGLAYNDYQSGRSVQALKRLAPVLSRAKREGQACLLARATWIAGACHLALARPLEAIEMYRSALRLYETAGEPENVANLRGRLADTLENIGEGDQAWRYRYQALRSLFALQSGESKSFVFLEAAIATLNLDLASASIPFQDASIHWADSIENALYLTICLLHKGNGMVEAGKPTAAAETLQRAWASLEEIGDSEIRSALQAQILRIEARLKLRLSDPQAAIDSFTAALDLLERSDERGYQAELYLQRSMAFEAARRVDEALQDLQWSMRETEQEWDRVFAARERGKNEDLLLSYFNRRRDTFDGLIRLLWERGRTDQALTIAERAQARELLDLVAGLPSLPKSLGRFRADARPLDAGEIQSRLGDDERLIEFRALEDRLLVWVVSSDRLDTHTVAVSRRKIEEQVGTVHRYAAGEGSEEDLRGALERLYSFLLAGPLRDVPPETELVFVPEGSIGGVPFAALRNPATGRYLIEDHPVSLAPSCTLRLYAVQRDREIRRSAKPSALLIGDPAFDNALFPGLQRLSGAAEEIKRVGESFPGSISLSESRATKAAFLRQAAFSEILHFAGHAVANPIAPSRSYLVLAPSDDDPGTLYAHELLALSLPRTRLVVLSACSTAGKQPVGTLGVSHLVRPFLAAGVPAVVGSLWEVHDEAGKELLSAFHRRFKRGESASAALRGAQLELLESRNRVLRNVFSWAPFQVIGSASLSEEE